MIQLTCSNCRALLVMDDAFAGGVCRCKHCGTIQTVPKPSRRQSTPGAGAPGANPTTTDTGQSKTLFQRPAGVEPLPGSGTGLDELATIVASSGLSGTGLQSGSLKQKSKSPTPAPDSGADRKRKTLLLVGLIAGAMLLSAGVTWFALRDPDSSQTAANTSAASNSTATHSGAGNPAPSRAPHFLGLPLGGKTIIYLLDRGSGTQNTFDLMREAAFNSLATLRPDQQFQVVFWETDNVARTPGQPRKVDVVKFPTDAPKPATPANVAAAREALKDVPAFGQSRLGPAIEQAFAANPDTILVATGKYGLEEETVGVVMNLRKNSSAKIHTFSLGESASPEVLKTLAERGGGQFKQLPIYELRQYAE